MQQHEVIDMWTHVMLLGRTSAPRGEKIRELDLYRAEIINPFSTYLGRKYPIQYLKEEFKWYLNGDPYDDSICKHAKMWRKIQQPGGVIFSNYGYLWFRRRNRQGTTAFDWVVTTLLEDPDSRQAVIPMLGVEHIFEGNKDVVCTKAISFRIIDGELNMNVEMRSSDAVFGVGTDLPCFSFLHQMVACKLHIPVGKFVFNADSLHIYEKHWNMVNDVRNKTIFSQPLIPAITDADDLLDGDFDSDFGRWLQS